MDFEKNILKSELKDIYGQEKTKSGVKSALLSKRNIVISGPPGIGKTTLAKNIARTLPELKVSDCGYNCSPDRPYCPKCMENASKTKIVSGEKRFIRVQGSPDLCVEDLIGDIDPIKALEFGPQSSKAFTPGKIFKANNGILFFDELNRCPEKLQNALLQVLEEGYATIGSYEMDIPSNFIFIGTLNPKDINTEKLSDVLLDRFDIIDMGYPESEEIETRILLTKGQRLDVEFPPNLIGFIVGFVRELRNNPNLEQFPSVRASLGLYERAQANALLDGKNKVNMDNIKSSIYSVINHRIKLKASSKYIMKTQDLIKKELENFIKNRGYDKESDEDEGDVP